jgi:cellulose synthase/poly-beta-1,6-N-acetylglucosamine synthase-like glycosyltransferase
MNKISIQELRTKKYYRLLEGSLAIFAISFFVFLILLSYFNPYLATLFIFAYAFLWLLRVTLICLHTLYGYKQLRRWTSVNWTDLLDSFNKSYLLGLDKVESMKDISNIKEWKQRVNQDLEVFKYEKNDVFKKPLNIYHTPIFAVYNESVSVLTRSLEAIYNAGYPLDKICVFVTQEGRVGEDNNYAFRQQISELSWVNADNISEKDNSIVFNENHPTLNYTNQQFENFILSSDKLNIIFVQHPDGLEGEIKGKASNESYAGRQISLFLKAKQIPSNTVLTTSLDADSSVGVNFFHMLSYKFCATSDRSRCGFQPIPVYSNNYFETHFWPRLVAANTSLWQFAQGTLEEESKFFANYSVPINVLQEVDFWQTDVIAEDALCFTKCFCHYKGNFRVVPFYGVFKGDAVEADTYLETIENQYRQLQRWAWGGVECLPYVVQRLFINEEGKSIDLKKRIKFTWDEFSNHFFWSTTPTLFSIGVFLPSLIGGKSFKSLPISVTISEFGSFFAWVSVILVFIFSYITLIFITNQREQKITPSILFKIIYQSILSSFIYGILGIPALDSQIRGLRGKYLGYWVTPKK